MDTPRLPADFYRAAVDRFDRLRAQGRLFYYPTEGDVVDHHGFKFHFSVSPAIARKPVLAADAPERRGAGGPFVDPDPEFVVGRLGGGGNAVAAGVATDASTDEAAAAGTPPVDHVVELSMHAMLRPHFVLHTRRFAPQTDDVDAGDWAASWAVMEAVRQAKATAAATTAAVDDDHSRPAPMLLYNCGYAGGASQGHKHVQVFPAPRPFPLFPEEVVAAGAGAGAGAPTDATAPLPPHPAVPFQHFVLPLAAPVTPARLLATYRRLLGEVRRAHREHAEGQQPHTNGIASGTTNGSTNGTAGGTTTDPDDAPSTTAYNVVCTPTWMCLIPRRRGGKRGTGAGALGMLGVLWLKDGAERAHWTALGMTDHLVWMGLPRTDGEGRAWGG
ncbi:5-p-4-tetraphosphate phosphorylase [Niveomyces insectorum RCEF 264]|uniref:5-p-4-tetraphosphate phosphorylase n=1 Tax=Niveomyces insectorum RCEF 264 TaxID=1081102 RepID=A0A167TBP4_9HYPO|nr:5-p-4-tetraphosphate phosphorylase [Niveomyces insectorum RCEF 264]